MENRDELGSAFEKLNADQREAVEHMDGPLLVIAGPGTGKTQLLSLRAANILLNRDVAPRNILCLTYTDAGAVAMKKRLVELIGRDAYGIEVSTFHGFASGLRARFPEYFTRGASAELVTSLHRKEIVNSLLRALPPSSPLYGGAQDGVSSRLSPANSFISYFKRSGLDADEFRAIMRQTLGFFDYVEGNTNLLEIAGRAIPRKAAEKEEFVEEFRRAVYAACDQAPEELSVPVVSTPGVYTPFVRYLREMVEQATLIDEDGKTDGYRELRDALFKGTAKEGKRFADRETCEKGLAIIDVYEGYEKALADENLYDFDDMIAEAIEAVRASSELQGILQEQYQYIQVDEFQDTNGAQLRIVELLTEGIDNPNIIAVGDDDQAIMRFQGASVACIRQFQELFNPKYVVLKTNYRSTPSIVEMGKGVACQVESRMPASATEKDVRAFRADDEQIEFTAKVFDSQDVELAMIAQDIRERIDAGFTGACKKPEEAIAVISPKHKSLRALIPYLRDLNIPFTYRYTSDVLVMKPMQTLMALIRCTVALAQGRESLAAWFVPQIISAPEFGIGSVSCVEFSLYAKRAHHGRWLTALASVENDRLRGLYARLLDWAGKANSSPVRELLFEMICPLRDYYQGRAQQDPFELAEFNAGIRALLKFVEGELTGSRKLDRAMRLPDVVERLDEAKRFEESIDASISIGREGAINLVSAHGSKGLEYDLVYLLDADDDTWHRGAAGTGLFASNLLIGDTKDEDDARRLLFVAVTRAKRLLSIYRAKNNIVRELQGAVMEESVVVDPATLAIIVETDWRECYKLNTPELVDLLKPDLGNLKLSASSLNDFVEYEDGCANSAAFPSKRMIKLPQEPAIAPEFGTLVHSFMEDYMNHVRSGGTTADKLAETYRRKIGELDFKDEEIASCQRRFDRIVSSFVPWFDVEVDRRYVTEASINALSPSGVPLYGKCDLLLIDDETKTIDVADYKTGFGYPEGKPTTGYERQLQFYKLLLENSPEYEGYTVTSCVDYYVEPERGTEGTIHEPVSASASPGEIAHLEKLIDAVWERIQTGAFDTSAFLDSPELAAAKAANVKKDGTPKEKMDHRTIQAAYEEWLINSHRS